MDFSFEDQLIRENRTVSYPLLGNSCQKTQSRDFWVSLMSQFTHVAPSPENETAFLLGHCP